MDHARVCQAPGAHRGQAGGDALPSESCSWEEMAACVGWGRRWRGNRKQEKKKPHLCSHLRPHRPWPPLSSLPLRFAFSPPCLPDSLRDPPPNSHRHSHLNLYLLSFPHPHLCPPECLHPSPIPRLHLYVQTSLYLYLYSHLSFCLHPYLYFLCVLICVFTCIFADILLWISSFLLTSILTSLLTSVVTAFSPASSIASLSVSSLT